MFAGPRCLLVGILVDSSCRTSQLPLHHLTLLSLLHLIRRCSSSSPSRSVHSISSTASLFASLSALQLSAERTQSLSSSLLRVHSNQSACFRLATSAAFLFGLLDITASCVTVKTNSNCCHNSYKSLATAKMADRFVEY